VKKAVIELDEFERNVRRALNYGHTFGHAIEVISNYKITHGQAVSIGIIIANELAREYGLLPKENCDYFNRLAFDLLDTSAIKSMQEFNSSELLALLRKDKKTENTKATLVLMKNAGDTVFRPTEIDFNLEGLVNSIIKRTF
jgi:3-dehydroquinate synthetase